MFGSGEEAVFPYCDHMHIMIFAASASPHIPFFALTDPSHIVWNRNAFFAVSGGGETAAANARFNKVIVERSLKNGLFTASRRLSSPLGEQKRNLIPWRRVLFEFVPKAYELQPQAADDLKIIKDLLLRQFDIGITLTILPQPTSSAR